MTARDFVEVAIGAMVGCMPVGAFTLWQTRRFTRQVRELFTGAVNQCLALDARQGASAVSNAWQPPRRPSAGASFGALAGSGNSDSGLPGSLPKRPSSFDEAVLQTAAEARDTEWKEMARAEWRAPASEPAVNQPAVRDFLAKLETTLSPGQQRVMDATQLIYDDFAKTNNACPVVTSGGPTQAEIDEKYRASLEPQPTPPPDPKKCEHGTHRTLPCAECAMAGRGIPAVGKPIANDQRKPVRSETGNSGYYQPDGSR